MEIQLVRILHAALREVGWRHHERLDRVIVNTSCCVKLNDLWIDGGAESWGYECQGVFAVHNDGVFLGRDESVVIEGGLYFEGACSNVQSFHNYIQHFFLRLDVRSWYDLHVSTCHVGCYISTSFNRNKTFDTTLVGVIYVVFER